MGYCPECGNVEPKPLMKKLCLYHYAQSKPKKPIARKPVKIKQSSDKRLKELAKYRIAREEYFKDHPVCEFPGCESTDVTLHHALGRIGRLLYDKKHFKSLCWPHHKFCEESPNEAKKLGLSGNRLESQ